MPDLARIFKPLLVFLLTIMAAVIVSSVVNRTRADQIAATYSIWFSESRPYGKISASALAGMSPDKIKIIQTVVPTRHRFEGQRANGDQLEIIPSDDGMQNKTITFAQQGIYILTNSKNSNISTSGSGVSILPRAVTPGCVAFRDASIVPSTTDIILAFHTLHVTIQDHGIVSEKWFSPDLGCQVLRSITTRQRDGAVEDIEVTSATTDPPGDSLFALPNHPVEMSPSNYWLALNPPDAGHKASDIVSSPYYRQQDATYARDKAIRAAPNR